MRAALIVLLFGVAACGEDPGACSAVGGGTFGGGTFGGVFVAPRNTAKTVTITSPAASPYTSTAVDATITVQGTATGSVSSVAWSGTGGSGACTGTTSWSCVVTLTRGTTQTITITATYADASTKTATKSVVEPTSWFADYTSAALNADQCVARPFITGKGSQTPVQCFRGTAAYRDSSSGGVRTLTAVGVDAHRIVDRPDFGGTVRRGALYEGYDTNVLLQSRDVSTTWAKTNAGDTFSLNSTNGPDGAATMDGIIGAAAAAQHGITQAPTLTAATWAVSAWAKAGNKTFAYVSDDTVANASAWFNLSTCAAATTGAGVIQAVAEDWGNSLCRIGIVVTGTAAAHTLKFNCASADNTLTFTGDGATVNCSMTRFQAEANVYPSSSIDTTTGSVLRNGEWVYYPAASNWPTSSQGAVYFEFFTQKRTTGKQGYLMTTTKSGGSAANAYFFDFDTTHHFNFFNTVASATQLNVTDTNVTSDSGSLQHVLARFDTNAGHLSQAGLEFATAATSGTLATSIAEMYIGSRETGFINPGAVISKIIVHDQVPARGIECLGDSITAGTAITTPYPVRLAADVDGEGYTARNDGIGGNTTTQQNARFAPTNQLYSHLIVGGTVNDRFNDDTVSTTETQLAGIIATARAAGLKIIMFTTTPWKGGFHWDTTKQAETIAVNDWIKSQAASDLIIDDEYAQMEDPAVPGQLLARCNSGDFVHPSQTCSDEAEQRLLALFMAMR